MRKGVTDPSRAKSVDRNDFQRHPRLAMGSLDGAQLITKREEKYVPLKRTHLHCTRKLKIIH